jgi:hypothetical protein
MRAARREEKDAKRQPERCYETTLGENVFFSRRDACKSYVVQLCNVKFFSLFSAVTRDSTASCEQKWIFLPFLSENL